MNIVKIFNESDGKQDENTTWSTEDVKEYVKQYLVYELQIISRRKDSKKDL